MNAYRLKKQLNLEVFTHDMLASILRQSVSNVNEKIRKMADKGEIVRLKRGVYVWGEELRDGPADLLAAANMLLVPSYVSFEYALSHHGLIPERVYEVTSATTKPKKVFDTPLGRFSYWTVPLQGYALGLQWLYDDIKGGRLIATPEKALCDTLRNKRGVGKMSMRRLLEYLVDDLRIEKEDIVQRDVVLIEAVASAYKSAALHTLAALIERERRKSA
jgi:hypothetical protein